MSNAAYLQNFHNLEDIATSLGGNLHDDEISKMVLKSKYQKDVLRDPLLDALQLADIQESENEIYLAVDMLQHSYQKRYCKLQEDLENDHTKGNPNYHQMVVKSYQMLNDFKHSTSGSDIGSGAAGISFLQSQGNKKKGGNNGNSRRMKITRTNGIGTALLEVILLSQILFSLIVWKMVKVRRLYLMERRIQTSW